MILPTAPVNAERRPVVRQRAGNNEFFLDKTVFFLLFIRGCRFARHAVQELK